MQAYPVLLLRHFSGHVARQHAVKSSASQVEQCASHKPEVPGEPQITAMNQQKRTRRAIEVRKGPRYVAGSQPRVATFRACFKAPSSLSFTICSRQPSRYLNSTDSWFLSALANCVPCTSQASSASQTLDSYVSSSGM